MAGVGLVILIGLVVNNAVVLIDLVNLFLFMRPIFHEFEEHFVRLRQTFAALTLHWVGEDKFRRTTDDEQELIVPGTAPV